MQSVLDIAKSQNAAHVFNVANLYGGKSQALKREIMEKSEKSGVRLAILQFTKVQGRSLMITSRMYLVLLAEFGGKGDRWVTIAESRRQKAVSRKQESASNRRVANSGVRKTTNKTQSAEGNVLGNS